jgi:hypothetical protein
MLLSAIPVREVLKTNSPANCSHYVGASAECVVGLLQCALRQFLKLTFLWDIGSKVIRGTHTDGQKEW